MITSQNIGKSQRGFFMRSKQITVLKMGQGLDHVVGQTLLPRRGIDCAHSKLTFVDLRDFMPD